MSQLVLRDNEAVQVLSNPAHPKHQRIVSQVQVIAGRKRRAAALGLAVPTAVRVEAGWDRTAPEWAFASHLRIADIPLDAAHANVAAAIGGRPRVSVADAHLGAAIRSAAADHITVVTSDPGDIRLAAGTTPITMVTV